MAGTPGKAVGEMAKLAPRRAKRWRRGVRRRSGPRRAKRGDYCGEAPTGEAKVRRVRRVGVVGVVKERVECVVRARRAVPTRAVPTTTLSSDEDAVREAKIASGARSASQKRLELSEVGGKLSLNKNRTCLYTGGSYYVYGGRGGLREGNGSRCEGASVRDGHGEGARRRARTGID